MVIADSVNSRYVRLWSVGALAIRALSLIPGTIDVDEAWFSASAAALARPWDYFRAAIDNKPPGTVWFYWLVGKILGTYPSPRLVRGFSLVALWLASRAVYRVVRRFGGSEVQGELSALFTIVASSVLCPQVMATTNEGLLILLLSWSCVFALDRAGGAGGLARKLAAGTLLGLAFLVKQTAIFYFIPVLAGPLFFKSERQGDRWLGASMIAIGFTTAFVPLAFAMGWNEYIYWTYTYPWETLLHARTTLFSAQDSVITFALVFAVWVPFLWGLKIRNHFVLAWLGAGIAAVAMGRALFPHYFLLLVPPLAAAAAVDLGELPLRGWRVRWLGAVFAFSVLAAAWPTAGLFWGMDSRYHKELAKRIQTLTRPDERIWVWGGTALPLSDSERLHVSAFATGRFLVPPYTTAGIRERFEREFSAHPPGLVLDLHERKDNRFDFPISTYPWLQGELERDYVRARDPSLPWATFYLRRGAAVPVGWRTGTDSEANLERVWNELGTFEARTSLAKLGAEIGAMDIWARARMSLALLPGSEALLAELELQPISTSTLEKAVLDAFSREHLPVPFPLLSRWWWVSWAIVKFQPGTAALAAEPCEDLMAFTWMLEVVPHTLKRVGGGTKLRHECSPLPRQTEPPNAHLELIGKNKDVLFKRDIFVPLTREYSVKNGEYVPGNTPEIEPILNLEIPWQQNYDPKTLLLRITLLSDGSLLAQGTP